MERIRQIALISAAAIIAASSVDSAIAQGRGAGQGPGQGQAQQQGQAPQSGRGSGPQQAQSQQSSRVEQQNEIRQRLRDSDIYGGNMMTAEERRQYRDRVNSAATDREWVQIRAQHMSEMQTRAQAEGRPLAPPVYGEHMMTRQERNEYQEHIASAGTEAERERVRAEHQEMIQERARALGLSPPTVE